MNIEAVAFAGFTMGVLGSLHCIGMCGPLALGLAGGMGSRQGRITNILLYNFGRSLSYASMGIILGLIGSRFALAGYQQILSIAAGLFIIFIFIINHYFKSNSGILKSWNAKIQELLTGIINKPRTPFYHLEVGIINAWLPCGLVYLALATALATANAWHGAIFMLLFGLGTTPLMAALMFAGNYLSVSLRSKLNRMIPVFILVSASLLILRGMNLGIPYVSPSVDVKTNCVRSCCHR
jgi:sulfite exporter TauE/SafE